MTDQASPGLGKAEGLFKDLVWDNLVKAGEAALFAEVPALAIWPLGPIARFIIGKFSDQIYEAARLTLDLNAIAFVNDEHRKAFDDAAVKLTILQKDKGLDSPEYKKAREDAKASFSKFVRFGDAPQ